MQEYTPFCPVDVRMTNKMEWCLRTEELVRNKKVLLLTSTNFWKRNGLQGWLGDMLRKYNIKYISTINSNPTVEDVMRVINDCGGFRAELILAAGGGSCIDLAKAISALWNMGPSVCYETAVDYIVSARYKDSGGYCDIAATPTTAGTGSEVTKWATVWDRKNMRKLSVEASGCFPRYAFIVPEFTLSLPEDITLSTGLDALCHAMEAYWARRSNALAQRLSLAAADLIYKALPVCIEDGGSLSARTDMLTASLISGLAFSMTKTTACHSISYPLTLYCGIGHGYAAALSLTEVMRRNAGVCRDIEHLYNIFGGPAELEKWMDGLQPGRAYRRLSYWGVDRKDILKIAEGAITKGRMDNNPIYFTKSDVCEILYQIY